MSQPPLKIGTRGSALALVQTNMVVAALAEAVPNLAVKIVVIDTSGDWRPEQGEKALPDTQGGKALFAKEIEEALLAGHIDAAVHSLKDMTAVPPAGLALDHVLPRADAREALLSNAGKTLAELPPGARVGTTSPRRRALLLAKRPDLTIMPLRGNVPTRIEKLRAGQVDATLLAVAGLQRLNLEHEIANIFAPHEILPPAGQGIIGIEIRSDDSAARTLFDKIHCHATGLCAVAERAAVAALGGSCQTPLGSHAVLAADGFMTLNVMLAAANGSELMQEKAAATVISPAQAHALGTQVGHVLRTRVPPEWLA